MIRRFTLGAWVLAVMAGILRQVAAAEELAIDLSAPGAAGQWVFLDKTASSSGGELVLDGRQQMSRAFFTPLQWEDVTLRAKFLVEPAERGVLACGFVVRAVDARTCYYVHFDRGQAILVRSDQSQSWNEIRRAGGLDKPAGTWHTGELRATGDTLTVSLNGKVLYEAKDANLPGGRIGFYANQGRAHVKEITVAGNAREARDKLVVPPPFTSTTSSCGASVELPPSSTVVI